MVTITDERGRTWTITNKTAIGLIEHLKNGNYSIFTQYGYNLIINQADYNRLMLWLTKE